ncbi:helix-turn-helix domain-containing protein [Acerihabitans arboris]|uniref:XRE family transcriptional regulator n=1 Tax=Acerihabitans arboris TaxID=2691583 RepID=A0A845SRC1_9GAMM|nr:helix-turn-helix transcriptional regulator [Acerihabitans arboris]NDL65101.1 XRE family transcriptional regulator [Acerihabitans arboris]
MANYNQQDLVLGSGNAFADLDLPDADNMKLKADIALQIITAIQALGLNQADAGKRMNLPQARVSALYNGKFFNMSEQKLMDCLNRLGFDIEITAKPNHGCTGHRTFSVV